MIALICNSLLKVHGTEFLYSYAIAFNQKILIMACEERNHYKIQPLAGKVCGPLLWKYWSRFNNVLFILIFLACRLNIRLRMWMLKRKLQNGLHGIRCVVLFKNNIRIKIFVNVSFQLHFWKFVKCWPLDYLVDMVLEKHLFCKLL